MGPAAPLVMPASRVLRLSVASARENCAKSTTGWRKLSRVANRLARLRKFRALRTGTRVEPRRKSPPSQRPSALQRPWFTLAQTRSPWVVAVGLVSQVTSDAATQRPKVALPGVTSQVLPEAHASSGVSMGLAGSLL